MCASVYSVSYRYWPNTGGVLQLPKYQKRNIKCKKFETFLCSRNKTRSGQYCKTKKEKKRERYEMHPSSHGNRRLRHDKMIVSVVPKKIIVEKLIACERLFKENQGSVM